jgi:hypothetical protein
MTRVGDDRVNIARLRHRRRRALLSCAALVLTGWSAADAAGAAAATSHSSGGASLLGIASTTGTATEPTVTFPGSPSTTQSVSPTSVIPTGKASGAVIAVDADSFTIQTRGTDAGVINAMTAYATTLGSQDYPYVWGGGHIQAQIASVGVTGPGHNGKRRGFDCSGAVAAVLAAGGLWPKGQGVPNDAGVIQYLLKQGLIARGPGTGPYQVTLYDDPGIHIFMNIDGRFFGTSDGSGGGDAAGGPGWLSDGAYDALNPRVFRRYHLLPSALQDSSAYSHQITFRYAGGVTGAEQAAGLSLDASVQVAYAQAADGALDMGTVSYTGLSTVTGTVTAVVSTGSQLTLKAASGRSLTLYVPSSSLITGLLAGETVTVTYTRQAATTSTPAELVLHSLTVTGAPATTTPAPTPPTRTTPTRTTPTRTTPTRTTPTPTVTTPATTTPTVTTPTPITPLSTTPTTPPTTATTASGSGVSGLSTAKDTGGTGF